MENLTDESSTFCLAVEKAVRGDKYFGRYQSVQNVSRVLNKLEERFGYYSSLCLSAV